MEQRTPVTSAVLSARSSEREALASILSQVYEDPAEVNAVIEEIGAGSAELVQISIRMLELMLSTKLEAQGDRLDTQHEEIRALGARLDALGTALVSLGAKIDRQSERLDEHDKALASQNGEIRALVEKLAALGAEVMALGAKLDEHSRALASQSREIRALAEKLAALGGDVRALDAKLDALQSDIRSLRREMRLVLAVFTLLIAIGLFGSFGRGCSRPVESHVGVEASQTVAEPSADRSSVPVVTPDPSGESVETDEPAQADQAPEVDGEGLVADPEARR